MRQNHIKTSVVLATFNGEAFIREQLQSIFDQTRKVDEVIILDDQSADNTIKICRNFIFSNKISNWSININKSIKGVFHNFLSGASIVSGDIIFFADQDDIWCPKKVERMCSFFNENPKLLSLTTTFSRFNEDGLLQNHVRHPNRRPNQFSKITLREYCQFPYYLGMSMAISKKLLEFLDTKIELTSSITHDLYLNFYATVNDGLFHLDEVLTKRRSYAESTSNALMTSEITTNFKGNHRLHTISKKIELLRIFNSILTQNSNLNNCSPRDFSIIEKQIIVNSQRFEYLRKLDVVKWLRSAYFLQSFSSVNSYLRDGFEIFKLSLKSLKNERR